MVQYRPDAFLRALDAKPLDEDALRAQIVDDMSAQRFISMCESRHAGLLPHAVSLLSLPAELGFRTCPEAVTAVLRGGKRIQYYRCVPWTREVVIAHQEVHPIPVHALQSISFTTMRDPMLLELAAQGSAELINRVAPKNSLVLYRYNPDYRARAEAAIADVPNPLLKAAFAKVTSGAYDDLTLREAYQLTDAGIKGINVCDWGSPNDRAIKVDAFTPEACEMILDTQRDVFRCAVNLRVRQHYLSRTRSVPQSPP